MQKGKKFWFKKVSPTLWVPVSREGWLASSVFVLALFFIYKTNDISSEIPISIETHGVMITEMVVSVVVLYWVSRGHVKK